MKDASCARPEFDHIDMYPDDSDYRGVYSAKAVCLYCPVKGQCLEKALTGDERFGIWGMTTPDEREAMKASDEGNEEAS